MAALVAVGAVLAVVGTLFVVRGAERTRRRFQAVGHRATIAARDVEREAAATRDRLIRAEADLVRLRARWMETDATVLTMTDDLRATRASLESFTSGRLHGTMRVAGWLSQAARLAMLWR